MAGRARTGSILTAAGIGAGAGAAQLGFGYGLGIIAWLPSSDPAGQTAWLSSLAWVTWLAGTSAAVGAICADRLGARATRAGADGTEPHGVTIGDLAGRIAVALAAAIGALITVPLVAVPARAALRADNFLPQFTAGAYAVVGVVVGLVVAMGALIARAIAANVIAMTAWLWALALVAVVDGLQTNRSLATVPLAVWQFSSGPWFRTTLYIPGAVLMLGAGLVIGLLASWPAGRRGDNRVGVALSGAFGPVLVAAAYFLAAPRVTGDSAEQESAYLIAPYAVLAGLVGSVLVAAIGPKTQRPPRPVSKWEPRPVPKGESRVEPAGEATPLEDWTRSLSSVDTPVAGGRTPKPRRPSGDDEPTDPPAADVPVDASPSSASGTTAAGAAKKTSPAAGRAKVRRGGSG